MIKSSGGSRQIKPRLLETGIALNRKIMGLSDAFKNLFAADEKDRKMVIPVCGYSGHRRGASAQNFFGRSFRDVSIQSKKYQRSLYKTPLDCDV